MNEEMERWKQKYFAKLEQFEAISATYDDHVNILQRLLVRVSLAASGIDEKLDNELASLRKTIRQKDVNAQALSQQLQTLEQQVLAMDGGQPALTDKLRQSLSALVAPLLTDNLQRDNKQARKRIQQQLTTKDKKFHQFPALIADIAALQKLALSAASKDEQQHRRGGLLGRLFASFRSDSAGGNLPEELQISALQADICFTDANTSSPDDALTEPGFSAVAAHIFSTLESLLEQLPLPETMAGDIEKVRKKLVAEMNWYEFIPTLDDVANLVIAAFGKGQKEFEAFLKALDARLVSIQGFLELHHSNQQQALVNKKELQQSMQTHLSALREEVEGQVDVGKLKSAVQIDLDAIAGSLQRFILQESAREQAMASEIEVLQQRLQKMEVESMKIQQQLVQQQQQAMTDGLTGLANRVAYEQRAQLEFERWKRYGSPLTMVIADIDKFKNINDRFGHLSGDKVIQLIGKEVSERIRKADFIARFGGEEFLILLPQTDGPTAFGVMDKAREMIARMPFHFQNERVQVTISMGLCEFRPGLAIKDVFELADKALYRAKSCGRNQVQGSQSMTES